MTSQAVWQKIASSGSILPFKLGTRSSYRSTSRGGHIVKRIPNMILVTTAGDKGCVATTRAWAASRSVKVVEFKLEIWKGSSAGFIRNDRIVALKPVEAIVCEGSGVQANLAKKLRAAGIPLHVLRRADQRPDDFTAANRINQQTSGGLRLWPEPATFSFALARALGVPRQHQWHRFEVVI